MKTRPTSSSSRPSPGSTVARSLLALAFTGATFALNSANAASGNWNGTTSGVWQLNGNWSGAAFPATGDTATFNGAGNGNTTIDIGTGLIVKSIIFDTSGAAAYTIGSGGVNNQTLNLNDLGAITVNSTVTNNELFNSTVTLGTATASTYTFTNNSANTLTFAGGVQGGTGGTGAAKTLTVTGAGNTTISGIVANGGASSLALTKAGSGTLTLTNANTYTGNTTISGGTLNLDFSASGAPTTNILASSALTLNGSGGELKITGKASTANTQILPSLAVGSGTNKITYVPGAGGTTALTITAALAPSASAHGILQFGTAGTTTLSANLSAAILLNAQNNAYATYGTDDWASTNASGVVQAVTYTSAASGFTTGVSNTVTGSFITTTSGLTLSSLRFADSTGRTVTYNTNTLTMGGILVASTAGTSALTGSGFIRTTRSAAGSNYDFNVIQNSANDFTIGTNIGNASSSNSDLVKSGSGRLILTNIANGYSSGTYVLGGVLSIGNNGSLGSAGTAVTLNGGNLETTSTLALEASAGVSVRTIALSSTSGLYAGAGTTLTANGVISGAGGLNINPAGGTYTSSGNTITDTGTVVLSAANSYSGGTTVRAGTLNINGINALGGANYGGLTLNGGTLQYATSFSGNGSGDLTSIGTAGVTIASGGGTIDTNGNSVTYAGSIGNGGSGALTKTGAGTLTLSSASTYTGGTTISGGTLAAGNAASLGSGALTIGSGGSLSVGAFNLGVGAITLTGSANLLLSGITSEITSSGAISISGSSNLLTLGGTAASAGNTYTLLLGSSLSASGISLTGSGVGGATVALGSNATVGRTTYAFNSTGTALQLAVTGGAFNLTWNGGNANWNTTDANWQQNGIGSNIVFFTGDNITVATADSIAVDVGGITAGTLAVTNASGTATLTGGTLAVASLSKSGAGTLQLSNVISGASLAVSGGTLDLGTQSQSFSNVSITGGSITGTTGVLTATGSAIDAQAGDVSAILAGSVGLTKTTSGTVVLTGTNTYTGATTISAGTLQIGNGGTTGSIASTSGVTNNGTLDYNRSDALTVGYVISGGGALVKDGTGTLTLTNANTYTGATTINAGTLQIGNGGTTGTIASTSGVTNNGTLDYNHSDNLTVGYAISGTGVVVKDGAGNLTLSGANTYAGGTTLNSGTLVINNGSALGSGTLTALDGTTISLTTSSGIGSNGISLSGTNAIVTLLSNQASAGYGSNFIGTADQTIKIGSNPVNVNSTTRQFANFLGTVNVQAGASLSDRSSSTNWVNGGDSTLFNVDGSISSRNAGNWALGGLTGSGTLGMGTAGSIGIGLNYTIGARNDSNDTFSGVIQDGDTVNNKLVSVTKTGTGILNLTGASTYTGNTAVNGGTLLVNGSLANTAVTVGVSGTLGGSGTIAGATVVNGTLAPGNSPGLLTFGSSLTLNSGSSTLMQVGGNTTAGTDYDKVAVTGALTFGGSLVVSSYDLGGGTYDIAQAATLHLFSFGSESGNFSSVSVVGTSLTYDSGTSSWFATGINGFDYNFALATGDLVISATSAVPEPSTYALFAGLAGLTFVITRRRRA